MHSDQIASVIQQEIEAHKNLDPGPESPTWTKGFTAGMGHIGKVLMRCIEAGDEESTPTTDGIADRIDLLTKIMGEHRRIKEISYLDRKFGVIKVVQETKMCC